nr:hypothetical protein [Mycoplasmopsis bovis]
MAMLRVHYISDSPTDKYGVNEKNLIEYFYKLKKEENKLCFLKCNLFLLIFEITSNFFS